MRSYVPRAHSLCAVLYPTITITQTTAPAWRLNAVALTFEPGSDRTRRIGA
jgi:hypothetical protein